MDVDLGTVLRAAVGLALDAGAMLRDEFHRAGGPRGGGDHADIDTEVDLMLRARLRSDYPGWSYFGEETGWDGPVRPDVYWLVDPNDGTAAYLRGRRGSAVSIALIRGDRPVLGVVYAPLAPDDDGDLFAWAEGSPLTRNGERVSDVLPEMLVEGSVALVSRVSSRRAPLAYSQILAPARFRAMPSIAYRLALNAAGEGDATVSVNGPDDYDVAGGHAVLIGAGGELVHADGEPYRYGARTRRSSRCFGGSLAVARELASRDWSVVSAREAPDPLEATYPPAEPPLGRAGGPWAEPAAGRLSRAHGCLFGQVAGDSLGSLVEFETAATIRGRYPAGVRDLADGGAFNTIAGQPTDDSEMALILARTLVREGRFDAAAVRQAYHDWRDTPPFDIGTTTARGLIGRYDHLSQSNGSLMRVSPLGIFGHAMPWRDLFELARADARLTHPNPVCTDATAVYAATVARAISRAHTLAPSDPAEEPRRLFQFAVECARSAGAEPSVRQTVEASEHEEPPPMDDDNQGWVLFALHNAFYQLLHAPSLEEGVVASVMAGGDTDTNAAVAGALLGAVYGREAVPARWRRAILACRPLAAAPGVRRPRARPFWPTDVPELAEALLLAGG